MAAVQHHVPLKSDQENSDLKASLDPEEQIQAAVT